MAEGATHPATVADAEYRWRGHRIRYVVQGDGPPMLLVHSIHAAAGRHEWRFIAAALADTATCYVIDLLGFGASDRPDASYTAQLYIDLLTDFLRDVVGKPAAIVGSSLGGTYAIAIAAAHPELVTRVVAIGPAGVSRLTTPGGRANRAVQAMFRNPVVGTRLFNAVTSRTSIRFFMGGIYADRSMLTPSTIDLFYNAARHAGARFAPAAFVGMQLNHDIRRALPALRCPLLLVWGDQATQTPLKEAAAVRALAPQASFVVLTGGDLPHEESPEAFLAAVREHAPSAKPVTS